MIFESLKLGLRNFIFCFFFLVAQRFKTVLFENFLCWIIFFVFLTIILKIKNQVQKYFGVIFFLIRKSKVDKNDQLNFKSYEVVIPLKNLSGIKEFEITAAR